MPGSEASRKIESCPGMPRIEIDRRLEKLKQRLLHGGFDGALLLHPADLVYFTGTAQQSILYVPPEGDELLFVTKSVERAHIDSPLERIYKLKHIGAFAAALEAHGIDMSGVTGIEADVLPVSIHRHFLRSFPNAEWVDATPLIQDIRAVKTPLEEECLRRAGSNLAGVFKEIGEYMRPGMSEYEADAEFLRLLRRRGDHSLNRIRRWNLEFVFGCVSSGPSAAFPIAFDGPVGYPGLSAATGVGSGRRKLRMGEPVLIDAVSGWDGYMADMTRIFHFGVPDPFWIETQAFIIELNSYIEQHLAPGNLPSQIYTGVMKRVREAGFSEVFMGCGENQVRFIGHGIGLELDEPPVIAKRFDIPIAKGNCIAIEPKIIFPGRGGVGLENTYLITADGFEKLTPLDEDIFIL